MSESFPGRMSEHVQRTEWKYRSGRFDRFALLAGATSLFFLALRCLLSEEPILTWWRPAGGIHERSLSPLAMVEGGGKAERLKPAQSPLSDYVIVSLL